MMISQLVIAGLLFPHPSVQAQPPLLHVMTWNVCAGTNAGCALFRRSNAELAWHVAVLATRADVVFLQEFCTGADADLEHELERRSGRNWSVRSAGLMYSDGSPYQCLPDRNGRPRGC